MTENDLEKKWLNFVPSWDPVPIIPREIRKIDYKDHYFISLAALKLNFKKIKWKMWFAQLLKTNFQKSDKFFGHLIPPLKGEIAQNLSRGIWAMLLATLKPNFRKIERKMWFTQLPKLRFAKNDENFSDFWSPPPLKKWNSQNCLERDLDQTVGYLEIEFP